MRPLKLSMLGVRGVVGETLTPELVAEFAGAFGSYVDGGTLLVSRDTRPSGEMVRSAVLSGLLATGCRVVDLGICPTPALQLRVRDVGAAGGVAISGGHNAIEWNALKFVSGEGLLLNSAQGEELLDVYHARAFRQAPWDAIPLEEQDPSASERQVNAVLRLLDVEAIRARQFQVAVDCCNGACCFTTPRLLHALGCRVYPINDEPEQPFPHDPEPNPHNMSQLRALVKATDAAVGFAHDADGERLGIVTDGGEALSEELTLTILADRVLHERPGVVVCNASTTLAMDVVAGWHNSRVVRTRVGQAYVVEAMRACDAVIGGEGSGGVVIPQHQYAHDSLAAIGLLLHHLARSGTTVSHLAARIPTFHTVKIRIECPPDRVYTALDRMRRAVEADSEGAGLDLTEGVRLVWPSAAVHVRASLTEPLIRVIAEAQQMSRAEALAEEFSARAWRAL